MPCLMWSSDVNDWGTTEHSRSFLRMDETQGSRWSVGAFAYVMRYAYPVLVTRTRHLHDY